MTSWYNSRYAPWRALRQTPYLAQPDTNIARAASALHNAGDPANNGNTAKDKKPQDSLFGPNIGVVSSGPAWTAGTEKKVLTDELTPEVVANWVERSKDGSQPTTTLQALVNLKRPTLRLSPLSSNDSQADQTEPEPAHHYHGLEFEYDCDAPKCGIYVHVYLPKDHPDAPESAPSSGMAKLLLFENVTEGGFGKLLKLEQGAMLELDRFEHIPPTTAPSGSATTAVQTPSGTTGDALPSTNDASATSDAAAAHASSSARHRRRFTHFHFRRRDNNHSVSGPALAVVDAEPAPNAATAAAADANSPASSGKGKDENNEGVRVIIRLAALDEQGTELASPNEQVTYLHIVRFGNKAEGSEEAEDTRPWVVKVVKREATIGPHTFHLHEIYGLSSQSSAHNHAPTAPLPTGGESHTYPPVSPVIAHETPTDEDPSSECLLCLSSPREVVLLPCRHLVACKDCALNMVEFGAGGNITQAEEPVGAPETPAPATGDASAAGETPGTPAITAPATPAVPAPTRRKRKAKGWFCPVCRQPYTSLLRITTNPPDASAEESAPAPAAPEERNKEATSAPASVEPLSNGTLPLTTADIAQPTPSANVERNGSTLSRSRGLAPSFLRSISFSRSQTTGDVESQTPSSQPARS